MTGGRPLLAVGVVTAVGAAAFLGLREGREAPARHVVDIRSFRFEPAEIAAAPGDTVVWINHDMVPHTVTARDGSWDSEALEPAASWSIVVPAAGAGAYLCSYHPNMTGAVVAP